jgi:hypothetical protein
MTTTTYLAEALATLHEASAGVEQWDSVYNASGTTLQSIKVERNKDTKDSLQSLRESIYSVARLLEEFKQNSEIPNRMNHHQWQVAEAIDQVSSVLLDLKSCLEFSGDGFSDELAAVADSWQDVVNDLDDGADHPRGAVQSISVQNTNLEGYQFIGSDNVAIGHTGRVLQDIATSNSTYSGSGLSTAFSHNATDEFDL